MAFEHWTPLQEAMYAVVHDYRGGAVALAPLVGMASGTLSNKVNPSVDTHKLSVEEAVVIQHAAHDCRILYAEAAALRHSCIPLGDYAGISDVELLNAYAAMHSKIGALAQSVMKALEDQRITRRECEEVERLMHVGIQYQLAFVARMKALSDEG